MTTGWMHDWREGKLGDGWGHEWMVSWAGGWIGGLRDSCLSAFLLSTWRMSQLTNTALFEFSFLLLCLMDETVTFQRLLYLAKAKAKGKSRLRPTVGITSNFLSGLGMSLTT